MCIPIPKETCAQCNKFINVGQSITECHGCNKVFHTKCSKQSNLVLLYDINGVAFCISCEKTQTPRYNPFSNWSSIDSDKPYNDHCGNDVMKISKMLNNCMSYTTESLNHAIKSQINSDSNKSLTVSSLFMNIDGNFTNFNHFQAIIQGIQHEFMAIGLAETNTSPDTSSLYTLPNHTPFYQKHALAKNPVLGLPYTYTTH